MRQAFRRQREKHALSKENDSQYNASFSLSVSAQIIPTQYFCINYYLLVASWHFMLKLYAIVLDNVIVW